MKNFLFHFIVILFLLLHAACSDEIKHKPAMVYNTDTLSLPLNNLAFFSPHKNWQARLFSQTQIIPIALKYNDSGFSIHQSNNSGVIEGPGKLYLYSGDDYFSYDVYLKNRISPVISEIDYRSPKTVNTDSSLTHQQILIATDQWRNISDAAPGVSLFVEKIIDLPAKAGIYRAQKEIPLSSYYVQPGTCTDIPLEAHYISDKNIYRISAGPMTDKFDNKVADGTLVTFIYSDVNYTNIMMAASIDGFAEIEVPADDSDTYLLYAKVMDIFSDKLRIGK